MIASEAKNAATLRITALADKNYPTILKNIAYQARTGNYSTRQTQFITCDNAAEYTRRLEADGYKVEVGSGLGDTFLTISWN